jgi:hypothetical protein
MLVRLVPDIGRSCYKPANQPQVDRGCRRFALKPTGALLGRALVDIEGGRRDLRSLTPPAPRRQASLTDALRRFGSWRERRRWRWLPKQATTR